MNPIPFTMDFIQLQCSSPIAILPQVGVTVDELMVARCARVTESTL